VILIAAAGYWFWMKEASPAPSIPSVATTTSATTSAPSASLARYSDSAFGFSFAYPAGTSLKTTALSDSTEFPGAIVEKSIQIGDAGGITVYEVYSARSTITDEPNVHASPLPQTKYFYDASGSLLVAYPQGDDSGMTRATTTATVSGHTTTGNLPILQSARRFDSRIIPLTKNKFLVIASGGEGSTEEIAASVRPL